MWFGVSTVEASTLGWVTMITTVANEVRNIGLVCLGLAIIIYGIKLFFRHRLEDMGETLSAFSIGGVFVGTGLTVPALLLGFAAGTPLVSAAPLPTIAESLGTALSFWMWQGPLLVGSMWAWRRLRHG